MNKKIFILILVCTIFLTAFSSKKEETKVESDGEVINTSSMKHKKCSRTGNAGSGIDVSLNYDLYYTGDILNILHSEEKVVATNESDLDTYEEAYKKIYKNYEGLKYYDAKVERGDTSVTSDLIINYDKIDIDALLSIEGEDDNIIENGKAKVDKWITLAKKFGTKCEDVDD